MFVNITFDIIKASILVDDIQRSWEDIVCDEEEATYEQDHPHCVHDWGENASGLRLTCWGSAAVSLQTCLTPADRLHADKVTLVCAFMIFGKC